MVLLESRLACVAGHSFDRARRGWWHLAQPQDARSREPGDAAGSIEARARLFERGLGPAVVRAVVALAGDWSGAALDLGCGGGALLAALHAAPTRASRRIHGIDLSEAAVRMASRRRVAAIFVANADRRLPFLDQSIDLATSIDARRPRDELARVSKPGAALVVAVPAADDLLELRAAVLGRGEPLPGGDALVGEIGPRFRLVDRVRVEERIELDAAGLADLAAATYRLSRQRERRRLEAMGTAEVVSRHEVLRFERAPGA
ncbi:MAG: rRNA ((745)-N(1))-methyltransferase [Planctomycetota bacterium]